MNKNSPSELTQTESVYLSAAKDANRTNLYCLAVLASLAVISTIFNLIGIFSIQRAVMYPSMMVCFTTFVLPIAIFLINDKAMKKDSVLQIEWFRNVIITCAFVGIGFICVTLSFHATILLAIPPLMAAQYRYRKKLFFVVFILTLVLVPVSIYGSFFFGTPDRNFIKGMLTEEESLILANRLKIATPKRMLDLFTHYTLPIQLGILAVLVLVRMIIFRNGKMIETQIALSEKVREEMEQKNKIHDKILNVLVNLIETRDVNTGEHVTRTKKLVGMIARALQKEDKYKSVLTDETVIRMENAAPLHDVGKIVVSDTILLKPAKLTADEFDKMKIHTTKGGELLDRLFSDMYDEEFLQTAKDIARYHHERWDGKGYPNGLSGEEIPLCARIMAIADVYDALISSRVYKPPLSAEEAFDIMLSDSGTHFDPDIMRVVVTIKDDLFALANNSADRRNISA